MGRLSIVVPPSDHLAQHRKLKAHEAELERRQRELESTIEHAQAELADVRREKAEIICERQGLRWSASFASEGAMEEVYDVPMTPEEVEARLMPSPVRRALEAMQREICMRGMGMGQGAGRGFGSTGKNVAARARRAGRGRTADGAKCMHKIRRLKRKQDRPRASSSSLERRRRDECHFCLSMTPAEERGTLAPAAAWSSSRASSASVVRLARRAACWAKVMSRRVPSTPRPR